MPATPIFPTPECNRVTRASFAERRSCVQREDHCGVLGNFPKTAPIRSKRGSLERSSTDGCPWPEAASATARKLESFRGDVLTFLVASGNDSNSVLVRTVSSSASLSYGPPLHLYTGSLPPRRGSSRAQARPSGRTGPKATSIHPGFGLQWS
jgi:hypothetical protein